MGARIVRTRRLEWIDTDAAGYWHHSTLWRYAEWLEAELHRELGITELTFGYSPRRHVEAEFHRPAYFDDEVTCTLEVTRVGTTSATYEVGLQVSGQACAEATLVVVLIDRDAGRPMPWPDDAAALLRGEATAPGA